MEEILVEENLKDVVARIRAAELKAGRDPGSVKLVGVTKTVPVNRIAEAKNAGLTDVGENYVNELREKAENLINLGLNVHFIGQLQSNKVKYIMDCVTMIHSVDRLSLAEEISKRALAKSRVIPCLVQLSLDGDESRGGISEDKIRPLLDAVETLPGISLKGLMCVPPVESDVKDSFKRVHDIFIRLKEEGYSMEELSMGMSADFEEAVICGATIVRVGSNIFGKRNYGSKA